MYGAMREHAPSSTRLAGLLSATALTLATGYALATGMGVNISHILPEPITYVALPDEPTSEPPPATAEQLETTETKLFAPPIELNIPDYEEEVSITGDSNPPPPPVRPGPAETGANVPPPKQPVRIAARMLPAPSPDYPDSEVRKNNQGLSRLTVCLDTGGRVTSAALAASSGHPVLDRAALQWVRDRRFSPAKLDGVPQSVCGHPVDYEWKLNRR